MDRRSEQQNHHGCQGLAEKGALLKTNRAQDGKDPSDENHLPGEKPMQWAGAGALESQGASSVLHGVEMKSKATRRAGSSKRPKRVMEPRLHALFGHWAGRMVPKDVFVRVDAPCARATGESCADSTEVFWKHDTLRHGRSGSGVGEWESGRVWKREERQDPVTCWVRVRKRHQPTCSKVTRYAEGNSGPARRRPSACGSVACFGIFRSLACHLLVPCSQQAVAGTRP